MAYLKRMNIQSIGLLLVAAMLFAVHVPIPAGAGESFKIVVVVNGTPITKFDIDEQMYLVAQSLSNRPEAETMSKAEFNRLVEEERPGIIETMIEEQLLKEEIDRLDLSVDSKQVDAYIDNVRKENKLETLEQLKEALLQMGMEYDAFRKKIESDMLKQRLVQGMVGAKLVITDTEIEEEFAKNPEFDGGMRARLRAIIVPSVEEMDAVTEAIDDGTDFAEVAKQYSKGPVPEEGGDMGFIAVTNLTPSWQDAIRELEVGQVSEAFEVDGNYVLLELVETTVMSVDDVPGMRDQLFNKLRSQKMSKLFDDYMGRLREMAVVEWK